MASHLQKEKHFRNVSNAFLAIGVLSFIIAGVSLGKDAKINATSLHLSPTMNTVSQSIASTPVLQRVTVRQGSSFSAVNPENSVEIEAPMQVPVSAQTSKLAAGGILGALGIVGGLLYILRGQSQKSTAPSFDPIALAPLSNYAMVSAAGEDAGLLKKPTPPELLSKPTVKASVAPTTYVTVEYQRKQAKALFDHFEALDQAALMKSNQKLGWTPGNEISNGRWVMFGWLVGMMTEYATGVSFVEQIKLTLNNLAILDLD